MNLQQNFNITPSVDFLQWLARGSLKQNLLRPIRFWVELNWLYGDGSRALTLPERFSFADWRAEFFSSTHPITESVPPIHDPLCPCAKTAAEWLFEEAGMERSGWREFFLKQAPMSSAKLEEYLEQRLFAVTRRSLQEDFQRLAELGWLQRDGKLYRRVREFPAYPKASQTTVTPPLPLLNLDLAAVAQNLAQPLQGQQRFFLYVDYVVTQELQDRVEDWQEELKQVWLQTPVPPLRLTYRSARVGQVVECVVYPVCIYYVRRTMYLCAWGQTKAGTEGWCNYRLDHIEKMRILSWQDDSLPQFLALAYQKENLPTPDDVELALSEGWGFAFYKSCELLLLRFERGFHDRYIQGSFRHETFAAVSYERARKLVKQNASQYPKLIDIFDSRSPDDAYYTAQVRQDDVNVRQRLRAWRPHGEVFLPLSLRQRMVQEVMAEVQFYQADSS
ncbi:MAG: TIGR03985 family CRISPR-associated protein [Halothece sp.]